MVANSGNNDSIVGLCATFFVVHAWGSCLQRGGFGVLLGLLA